VPHPRRRTVAEQVHIQLIEAAVDTGFGLIDDAKDYRASGEPELSSRALKEAGEAVTYIEGRLQQLGGNESRPFLLLVAELRNEIAEAERETS
jgi:hypothetical protein